MYFQYLLTPVHLWTMNPIKVGGALSIILTQHHPLTSGILIKVVQYKQTKCSLHPSFTPSLLPSSPLSGHSEPVGVCIMSWGHVRWSHGASPIIQQAQTHYHLQHLTHRRLQWAFSPPSWDGLLSPGCDQGCPSGKRVSLLVHFFIESLICDGHVTILRLPTLNMWQSYDPLYSSVWLRHCS